MKQFASQLVSQDHYERAGIDDRLQRVLDRWTRLRQAMMEYRSRLGESQTLQDFSRDAEEIEAWIADKLAAASDEPVKETQNLQVKRPSFRFPPLVPREFTKKRYTDSLEICIG